MAPVGCQWLHLTSSQVGKIGACGTVWPLTGKFPDLEKVGVSPSMTSAGVATLGDLICPAGGTNVAAPR